MYDLKYVGLPYLGDRLLRCRSHRTDLLLLHGIQLCESASALLARVELEAPCLSHRKFINHYKLGHC